MDRYSTFRRVWGRFGGSGALLSPSLLCGRHACWITALHDDRIWTKTTFLDKKIKSSETLIFFSFGVFFYRLKRISYESIFRRSYSTLKITFYVQLRLLASTIRSTVSAR